MKYRDDAAGRAPRQDPAAETFARLEQRHVEALRRKLARRGETGHAATDHQCVATSRRSTIAGCRTLRPRGRSSPRSGRGWGASRLRHATRIAAARRAGWDGYGITASTRTHRAGSTMTRGAGGHAAILSLARNPPC